MRIVFMGNPKFAIPSLRLLSETTHDLMAVVTNQDKPQGRGRKPLSTPVANYAGEIGIPIIYADNLKDENLASSLVNLEPDLFIIVAFRILPLTLLKIPRLGCINLHGSLLPKYRGAAPIQWALLNGDSLTGLTTFLLKPSVDTGDILLKREVVIYPDDDFGALSKRMSLVGAQLLKETVDKFTHHEIVPLQQDDSQATKAPKIKREMSLIRWDNPALEIHNQIRALSPVPGTYSFLHNRRLKICLSKPGLGGEASPGTIIARDKNSFRIACGSGSLEVFEVQAEGKKRMSAREYLAGARLQIGECFDTTE